jgi:hypothetical protein
MKESRSLTDLSRLRYGIPNQKQKEHEQIFLMFSLLLLSIGL